MAGRTSVGPWAPVVEVVGVSPGPGREGSRREGSSQTRRKKPQAGALLRLCHRLALRSWASHSISPRLRFHLGTTASPAASPLGLRCHGPVCGAARSVRETAQGAGSGGHAGASWHGGEQNGKKPASAARFAGVARMPTSPRRGSGRAWAVLGHEPRRPFFSSLSSWQRVRASARVAFAILPKVTFKRGRGRWTFGSPAAGVGEIEPEAQLFTLAPAHTAPTCLASAKRGFTGLLQRGCVQKSRPPGTPI